MKVYSCCGHETVVKRHYCPSCRSSEIEEREVPNDGTIYSYTRIHVPPVEFEHIAPYSVVLVQLEGTKAKVTGRMTEEVTIGDRVQFAGIDNGAYLYTK